MSGEASGGASIEASIEARAWGWIEHLTAGGTTPWRDWHGEAAPRSRLIPGAQHLEVVRRLNLTEPASSHLAEIVLHTSGPGRGQQDLDLAGIGDRGFGALPIDPSDVPAGELLRVASGALADLTLTTRPRIRPEVRRPRRRRTHYRLTGDPLLAAAFRRQLRGQGRPQGGRHPQVVVLLSDYGTYLADVWAARARRGNGPPWQQWIGRFAGKEGLPQRTDILVQAARWADRVGRSRVHLAFAAADVARITGAAQLRSPRRLSHAALEVVRHTSTGLRLVVDEERRTELVSRTLVPWLRDADDDALPGPVLPRRHHGWLAREAARIRDGLAAAGYPVPGESLDGLLPVEPVRTTSPDDEEVLGVMLKALHRGARRPEPEGGSS